MTCTLYRHFDASGALLYVGIAKDALRRTAQHMAKSHWAHQMARVTFEHFDNRKSAEAAERRAILEENPMHNIRRLTSAPPADPTDGWRGLLLRLIKDRGETMRSVSKRAGLSHGYLHGVLIDGKDPTIDKFMAVCAAIPVDAALVLSIMQNLGPRQ